MVRERHAVRSLREGGSEALCGRFGFEDALMATDVFRGKCVLVTDWGGSSGESAQILCASWSSGDRQQD